MAQYKRIRRLHYLGDQYQLLGEYADQFNVRDLELSIHRDDKARDALASAVKHYEDDGGGYYAIDPQSDYPVELFEPFRFPVFDLTKLEMREIARQRGFDKLLNLTWFCHTPENGKPCGLCNPCLYTIEEGLIERIPPEHRGRRPPLKRRFRVFVRDSVTRLSRLQRRIFG